MKIKMEQFSAKNPNPVLSVAKDGTVLYSNGAGKPLLNEWGVEVGDKLPSYIQDLVQKVISRNSPKKIEVKAENRIYLVAFHPLPEENCVNIYGFDISDQKEFEEKLLESEEKYRQIATTAREGIWTSDAQGIITFVNEIMVDWLGYSVEELLGKSIFNFILKEDLDSFYEYWRTRKECIKDSYDFRLKKKDGSHVWVIVNVSPLRDAQGNSVGNLAMFSNITKREQAEEALLQSEQHYRLLFETMLQGVVYQDADGKTIYMNPAAERILGKTQAEFLGSSSEGEEQDNIREDGSPFPGMEHPAMVSLRTGQEVQNVVMGVYNPRENCYRWININAVPLFRTGENKPFQVYTLFDDITQRKCNRGCYKEEPVHPG